MIILKEQDVISLLSNLNPAQTHALLSRFHALLRRYTQNKTLAAPSQLIHQPERTVITTNTGNTTLFMPSSLTTSTGVKVVTVPQTGTLKGSINIFAPDGELQGVLNAGEITAFRTSLAVMIPFVRYRGAKADVLIFGAGRQAEWHTRLALLLSDNAQGRGGGNIKHITVVNRTGPGRLGPIFEQLRSRYPDVAFDFLFKNDPEYEAKLQGRVASADVIFCCTPSTTVHFPYSYLAGQKKRFISLIGSYKPHMQEIDAQTVLSGDEGRIYVDTKEGCLAEAGELIMAGVEEGQLVEVGELEDGDGQGDTALKDQGNVIFKCVGLGIMDVFMAGELLEMARHKGLGFEINDF